MMGFVQRRAASAWFLIGLAAIIFASSYLSGVLSNKDSEMFSAPYRWRQAALAALSMMVDPPARHYDIHRSLLDYTRHNGMPILGSEYDGPVSDPPPWLRLLRDGNKVNALWAGALSVPVDVTLPPDVIRGNEVGYADFFLFAFRLFGPEVQSLYKFYFLLFAISITATVVAYRNVPTALFMLCVYLAAHLYAMDYQGRTLDLNVVFNSRGFSALGMLPGLHLAWACIRPRDGWRPRWPDIVQIMLLAFLIYCRTEVAWVALALLSLCLPALWRFGRVWGRGVWDGRVILAGVLVGALVVVRALPVVTLSKAYGTETGDHLFWHAVYTGLVSAHPTLGALYLQGDAEYSDSMGYNAVLRDLRARDDASSPIAFRRDGQIFIDVSRNFSEYDRLIGQITRRIILEHPLECIGSMYYKARNQIDFFGYRHVYDLGRYIPALGFVVVASILLLVARPLPRFELLRGLGVAFLFALFSLMTPMLDSTTTALGTLVSYVMMFFVVSVSLPIATVVLMVSKSRHSFGKKNRFS